MSGLAGAVAIIGTGTIKFGENFHQSLTDMIYEAVTFALADAGIERGRLQAAWLGCYEPMLYGFEGNSGTFVSDPLNLFPIPVTRVAAYCATGIEAVRNAALAVASGEYDLVLAVGAEKMREVPSRGSLVAQAVNRGHPVLAKGRTAPGMFALLATRYFKEYGADEEALGAVAMKNHYHGSLNPYARYQRAVTVEEVLASRRVEGPLTQLMCAPPGDGAACLVLCARGFPRARTGGARIAASVLLSSRGDDMRQRMTIQRAVQAAYDLAGVGPEDLDVLELYDATAVGELLVYPYLGICANGDSARLVRDRVTWLGGRLPANTSGGLLSRGHPAGATGAAQVVELVWQLEGRCGARQVSSARVGLAENPGGWLGSDAAVCGMHILQA